VALILAELAELAQPSLVPSRNYQLSGQDAIRIARSLVLPKDFPDEAPRGQQARELAQYSADHPGWNLSPGSLLAAYAEAESGFPRTQCRMFDDIVEADCTLNSLLLQRRQAVAGKPWLIQACNSSSASQRAAEVLTATINKEAASIAFEHLLNFNKYGFAAVEIQWNAKRINGKLWIVPEMFLQVQSERFMIGDPSAANRSDVLRLITDDAMMRGEDLIPGKWIIIDRAGPRLAQGALMRSAAWPAMGKRFAFRDWLIFSEKFGIPLINAVYDPETDDENIKKTATEIVRNMGGDGGAVSPKTIDVKIIEAGRTSDNSAAHGGLISYANAEMAKLINGATLSSDNSGSSGASYALGEIHNNVRWDNVIYDASRLTAAFRAQLFAAFMRFNGMQESDAPNLHIQVVRDETPAGRIVMARGMKELGVPVKPSQLYQETGFDQPNGKDSTDPSFNPATTPAATEQPT
jgi:phage gp29-like protein